MLSIRCNSCGKIMNNQEKILKEQQIKYKPFINKYKWEGIKFPEENYDWKIFEKNNVRIALNVLYAKKRKIISYLCFKK